MPNAEAASRWCRLLPAGTTMRRMTTRSSSGAAINTSSSRESARLSVTRPLEVSADPKLHGYDVVMDAMAMAAPERTTWLTSSSRVGRAVGVPSLCAGRRVRDVAAHVISYCPRSRTEVLGLLFTRRAFGPRGSTLRPWSSTSIAVRPTWSRCCGRSWQRAARPQPGVVASAWSAASSTTRTCAGSGRAARCRKGACRPRRVPGPSGLPTVTDGNAVSYVPRADGLAERDHSRIPPPTIASPLRESPLCSGLNPGFWHSHRARAVWDSRRHRCSRRRPGRRGPAPQQGADQRRARQCDEHPQKLHRQNETDLLT